MWPSWCYCHSLSLASVISRLVLPFWYRLTWVVSDKGPLNGCVWCYQVSVNITWRCILHSQRTLRQHLIAHVLLTKWTLNHCVLLLMVGSGCRRWSCSWKVCPSGFKWTCRQEIRRQRRRRQPSDSLRWGMVLKVLSPAAVEPVLLLWAVSHLLSLCSNLMLFHTASTAGFCCSAVCVGTIPVVMLSVTTDIRVEYRTIYWC